MTKRRFDEDGFLVVSEFFDTARIEGIKDAVISFKQWDRVSDKDVVWEGNESDRQFKYIQNINYYVPECHRIVTNRLLDLAAELLGEEVMFVNMEIHDKAPAIGSLTPAHQDNFYFRLTPPSALTAYIPLEMHKASVNGGLKFLKGSNKLGTVGHKPSKVKAFSSLLELDEPERFETYYADLKPGDIVLHHANTVHFADENRSQYHRRSLSLRFIGISAKPDNELQEKYRKNYESNWERKLEEPIVTA